MFLKVIAYIVAASLVACLYFIGKKHLELKNSDQFEGEVVRHIPRKGSKGRTNYALEVAYTDKRGQRQVFTALSASNPPMRPIGAKVPVFARETGSKPDILVFESVYLGLWIWLCVGVAVVGCLLAPTVMNIVYLKERPARAISVMP